VNVDVTNYYLHDMICIIMAGVLSEYLSFAPCCCSTYFAALLVFLLVFLRPLHQDPLKVIKKCPPGERFNTLQVNSLSREPHPILSHSILPDRATIFRNVPLEEATSLRYHQYCTMATLSPRISCFQLMYMWHNSRTVCCSL
jgi:hypothetical protein